jgi:cell division protein FtsN
VRRQRGESRVGSILAFVGCLGVLGATFGVGVYAGRYWTRASLTSTASATPAGERAGARGARPAPPLTFYQELTAPLGEPAPAAMPKSAATEPRRVADRNERSERAAAPARPSSPERSSAQDRPSAHERPSAPTERADRKPAARETFTVQVGAYRTKAAAETLRRAMAAAGHDVYVSEADTSGDAARYRVRVGSFGTREAATAAAARLRGEGQRSTYVTTR